jgi:hypothetical protein
MVDRDKHSSLFWLSHDEEKKVLSSEFLSFGWWKFENKNIKTL